MSSERDSRQSARRVLVTGHCGLIGSHLCPALEADGYLVVGADMRATGNECLDILDREALRERMQGCEGVVHLAAVSRVVDAEKNPEACWQVNVDGTDVVLQTARSCGVKWLVYASSREVYGHVGDQPISEDHPLKPINVYGRSKVAAEELTAAARADMRIATTRFSNVYGGTADHATRVVPAFVRAALAGGTLVVNGANHTFDFVHVADLIDGLKRVVAHLSSGGESLPTMHFVTGKATTLAALADSVLAVAGGGATVTQGPERTYDVAGFVGDGSRAWRELGWKARISVDEGLRMFVDAMKADGRVSELS